MHTGGDVKAGRHAFLPVAYGELGGRGVAWG
jgi:hypothetical protein